MQMPKERLKGTRSASRRKNHNTTMEMETTGEDRACGRRCQYVAITRCPFMRLEILILIVVL